MELSQKTCIPCRGGVPPLTADEVSRLSSEVSEWSVVEGHHIKRDFKFSDFSTALKFVNSVGRIAEEEGHHPDIYLTWGEVGVTIWTHKIDGLTESDFILAAKIDKI